jgi:heme A synthase
MQPAAMPPYANDAAAPQPGAGLRTAPPPTAGATTAPAHGAAVLAIGFGTTVAMWAVGYCARLFGDAVPPVLVFALLLAAQLAGGFVAGCWALRGLRTGLLGGLLTGVLNLLIVGSLMGGQTANTIRQGAVLWVPGTLGVCALLGFLGALLGRFTRGGSPPGNRAAPHWPGLFAAVAVIACLLLLAAGGLVTGYDEGLAVVDWPNTEGYNMFLYPLARMTGGIYLEHSHRLLGSLVGLTTLVLAIHVQRTERRRWVRRLAWAALAMVTFQGILGGLRVTGHFTLSTRPADTDPKVLLAIIHGVFGQLVFAALVALAAARARRWTTLGGPTPAASAGTDRAFGAALITLIITQLVLGALVRHFSWALDVLRYGLPIDPARLTAIGQWALNIHITVAVLVALLTVAVGVRAWGLYGDRPILPRLGSSLLALIAVQLGLGIAALIVSANDGVDRRPDAWDVGLTTLHQVVGAGLLAWAVMLVMSNYRLLTPLDHAVLAPAPTTPAPAERAPGC